jgi:hypothetical protein
LESLTKGGIMLGPFLLKYHHMFVGVASAGAFILSRNGRVADYVGASADDLIGTLGRFAQQSDYRYFWFVDARSAGDAAKIEQAWLHRYRPTDNPSRSSVPHGTGWRCTTEGCAACALAGAAH